MSIKSLLLVLAILAINNLALLYWLGYFEAETKLAVQAAPNVDLMETQVPMNKAGPKPMDILAKDAPRNNAGPAEAGTVSHRDLEFLASLQNVVSTNEFMELMDQWQEQYAEVYKERERRFATLDAAGLLAVAQNSNSRGERQSAIQLLLRNGLTNLNNYQLQTLYGVVGIDSWAKSKIALKLLEGDDPQGMVWAKEIMQLGDARNNRYDHELLIGVYERDPAFIADYIDNLDVGSNTGLWAIVNLAGREPELAERFLNKHFDALMHSANEDVARMRLHAPKFELSTNQQSELLSLLDSSNRKRRQFAMNYLSNVVDTEALRSAFASVTRPNEQKQFIVILNNNRTNREHRDLARQLAEASGDQDMLRIISR